MGAICRSLGPASTMLALAGRPVCFRLAINNQEERQCVAWFSRVTDKSS
jgi:hypothetical protein